MANLIDNDLKVLGETEYGFGQNRIVRTASGRLYSAHITETDDIEVLYSDNDGSSWSSDTTFSESDATFISMCKSEDDDIYVAYFTGSGTSYTYKIKKRDYLAGTWSEVKSDSITVKYSDVPPRGLICYNRNVNRLHRTYIYHNGSVDKFIIKNAYSNNKGTDWTDASDDEYLSTSTSNIVSAYGLDTNPVDGKIWFMFIVDGATSNQIRTRSYTSIGGSPGNEYLASGSPYAGALAIDSAGNVYRIQEYSTYFYIYRNSSELVGIGDGHYAKYGMVAIGIDGGDKVYFFYTKNSDGKLYYRKYDGSLGAETLLVDVGTLPTCEHHSVGSSSRINYCFNSNV